MSELINTHDNHATIRWKLLTGASALALAAYVSSGSVAKAEDANHPLIWIDLSGQAAWNESGQEAFLPPFLLSTPRPPFETESPQKVERVARVSWDESAQISFEPAGSKWVLSAGIRYGRSGRHQYLGQLTQHFDTTYGVLDAYQNITSRNSGSHAILDFRAGRDVGLGQFGSSGTSVINAGVRFVQFDAKSSTAIQSQPTNLGFSHQYHKFNAHFLAARKFSAVGPSLSWDASAAVAGNSGDGEIGIDWGINGALLFGRQSVRGHHQTTNVYYKFFDPPIVSHYSAPLSRSKRVTVPNLGGYAALSWRYEDAKVSFGYRADMFFNAIDGGIDTAKKENRAFYGPYASISIGVGD